jgi:hypothetical protein
MKNCTHGCRSGVQQTELQCGLLSYIKTHLRKGGSLGEVPQN